MGTGDVISWLCMESAMIEGNVEFVSKKELFIVNTRFQQKDSKKWTWMTPDGKHTNMIDLVLVNKHRKQRCVSA